MRDVTTSYVTRSYVIRLYAAWLTHMWRNSPLRGDSVDPYVSVWHDSLMHETWLTHTYICMYILMHICQTWLSRTHGMTRSCMRRDSLIHIYVCIYICIYVKHESHELMVWLAHAWDVTHSYVYIHVYIYMHICHKWISRTHGMTRSCMRRDSLIRIYVCIYIRIYVIRVSHELTVWLAHASDVTHYECVMPHVGVLHMGESRKSLVTSLIIWETWLSVERDYEYVMPHIGVCTHEWVTCELVTSLIIWGTWLSVKRDYEHVMPHIGVFTHEWVTCELVTSLIIWKTWLSVKRDSESVRVEYGVATISRLLKIIGLFCRI